uniref:Dual specificity phosphatase 22 n=1 Tax=Apteryx owenii TaxID=8824 RepID=A0A8B9PWA2_APTOW
MTVPALCLRSTEVEAVSLWTFLALDPVPGMVLGDGCEPKSNRILGVKYLCIPAADSPSQNLARHFRESIKFIHECRLTGEGCLVHCLAGVSRSVTLVIAYIMTITDFGWEDALSVVRAARSCANPNMGFQRQLQEFEKHDVDQFRQWLKEEYGENSSQDLQEAKNLLSKYKEQAELQQSTGGRQWNNNFSSVPSLSYNNYTTET